MRFAFDGIKLPVPIDPHWYASDPSTLPLKSIDSVSSHTFWLGPAKAVTAPENRIFISSESPAQFPFPKVVSVRVTDPFKLSACEGVYSAVSTESFGKKVPLPAVVHTPPVAPCTFPSICTGSISPHIT